MDKKNLQRRAGITEQTEDIKLKQVADAMTRLIMGDPENALRQLQQHRQGVLGFRGLANSPEEYNRVFAKINQNFLYNLMVAKEYSDEK